MARPPLTYYGGKQTLSKLILTLIPPHNLYCEPFFGGGAVFFAKEPSNVEVINDTNGELINFYKVIQTKFRKLERLIRITLHSREYHASAKVIIDNPHLFDEVTRAWAIWASTNQSFGSMIGSTWRCDFKQNSSAKRLHYKRKDFDEQYSKRLEFTQIDCKDALQLIESLKDNKDAFFYCDPPYFNSNQGSYKGYTEEDFEKLLKKLSTIKGKFLLSSYPSPLLEKYTAIHKWQTKKIEMQVRVQLNRLEKIKMKTEVLTANYELPKD